MCVIGSHIERINQFCTACLYSYKLALELLIRMFKPSKAKSWSHYPLATFYQPVGADVAQEIPPRERPRLVFCVRLTLFLCQLVKDIFSKAIDIKDHFLPQPQMTGQKRKRPGRALTRSQKKKPIEGSLAMLNPGWPRSRASR